MTKKEQTQQKIKQAAVKCFRQYGLEKTTLDDIAKLVGLNKATFYYYYKNKEDIFLEVALQEGQVFLQKLKELSLAKKTAKAQILLYLTERVSYYRDVLTINKVSAQTLAKILPSFFAMYEHIKIKEIQFLESLIKFGNAQKEFSLTPVTKHATLFINISDAMKHKAEIDISADITATPNYEQSIEEIKIIINQFLQN